MKELFRVFDMEGISASTKIAMLREVNRVWGWENASRDLDALTGMLIAILDKRRQIEQVKE